MNESSLSLIAALANVRKEMKALVKDSVNPHFRSKYADLNGHLDELNPLLEKNGLLLTQLTQILETSTGAVHNVLVTEVIHVGTGESKSASIMLPEISDPQKILSSITYYRRGQLNAMFGMKAEDDDGNSISSSTGKAKFVAKSAPATAKKSNDDF